MKPLHPALLPPEPERITWLGNPEADPSPAERERFLREYECRWSDGLKGCDNPLCDRPTKVGTGYCCHTCATAHADHWEIGTRGVDHPTLCHSDGCETRTAERLTPRR